MAVVGAAGVQAQSESLLLLSATLIATGLALFIVFHAYWGYRRNDSVRMLYLACGLCLLTVVPMGLSIGANWLGEGLGLGPEAYTFYLPLVSRLVEITGLGILLYSLLVVPGRARSR